MGRDPKSLSLTHRRGIIHEYAQVPFTQKKFTTKKSKSLYAI